MKVKLNKLDKLFSRMIRTRDHWRCQSCGTQKQNDPGTFDCAHIMGRRSVSLRWHPANAIGLCRGCHLFYTEHPFDWRDFCIGKFGEDRVAELRLVSTKPVKWSKSVREEIYQFYRELEKAGEVIRPHEIMHQF